ncbi:sensor histidine kinase [Glycomyces arizonensis]|uniref:sensor histidine kinase n=1 Tax=Glycomyces arizonensis TaxID=256035 RepID=UPI0003FDC54F|nr:histidine kinase [Glycomyces arizonensis]
MAQTVTVPRKPGLWQRMSEFDSRHPLLWNLAPVLVYVLFLIPGAVFSSAQPRYPGLQLILAASLMVPLVWRRRYPFAVLLSQLAPTAVTIGLDLTGARDGVVTSASSIAVTLALYNLVLRRRLTLVWWAAAIAAGQAIADFTVNSESHSVWEFLAYFFEAAFFFGFVLTVAMLVRTRRNYQESVRHGAAREAVQEERTRIAREMHDIIGHNLAVINALADGGAYAAAASPERAREALTAIGATSRQALSELRRVLSVLQAEDGDESAEMAPQPGMSDLGPLVDRVRDAGLPVTFKITGRPWEMSENQQLTVYRTVQEALTNVLKHATGPRRAQVALDYRDDGLGVAVANTGSVVEDAGTPRGLLGLRERAAVFGGTMEAGPQPTGGWRVALWLPADGPN